MPSAYDTYDYPAYWVGRKYEHESEVLALTSFLKKIQRINTALEIGVGFGRLIPNYLFRVNKLVATDPSAKLLKIAKENLHSKKIKFIKSNLENLPKKVRKNSVNLIIVVRVFHHLEDLDKSFRIIKDLLKDRGFLIIEFANKSHLKATFLEFLKGNFTFPLDIFPKDVRGKNSLKKQTLPFKNYHPDTIFEKLKENGFSMVEIRSVSNVRSPLLKKILSLQSLLFLEKYLQKPLAHLFFGPSIFILAQKTR